MIPCPSAEELTRLLDGTVPADLEEHVETCPACQQELERLGRDTLINSAQDDSVTR